MKWFHLTLHKIISAAENGVSTHHTFLDAAQDFDEYLEQIGVQHSVVLLSDGHGSHLNHDVFIIPFFHANPAICDTSRHCRCDTTFGPPEKNSQEYEKEGFHVHKFQPTKQKSLCAYSS